jgi:hypothetical protein
MNVGFNIMLDSTSNVQDAGSLTKSLETTASVVKLRTPGNSPDTTAVTARHWLRAAVGSNINALAQRKLSYNELLYITQPAHLSLAHAMLIAQPTRHRPWMRDCTGEQLNRRRKHPLWEHGTTFLSVCL